MNIIVIDLTDGWSGQASTLAEADRIIEDSREFYPDNEWQITVEVDAHVRSLLENVEEPTSVPKISVRHADERWPDTEGESIPMHDAEKLKLDGLPLESLDGPGTPPRAPRTSSPENVEEPK